MKGLYGYHVHDVLQFSCRHSFANTFRITTDYPAVIVLHRSQAGMSMPCFVISDLIIVYFDLLANEVRHTALLITRITPSCLF